MTELGLSHYLGLPIQRLLDEAPFSGWRVRRTVDPMPALGAHYVFDEHGFAVVCDEHESVATIFCKHEDGQSLLALARSLTRAGIRGLFGAPERSEEGKRYPVLGYRGPWDRYLFPQYALHFQYTEDGHGVDMVTLMRPDRVPR